MLSDIKKRYFIAIKAITMKQQTQVRLMYLVRIRIIFIFLPSNRQKIYCTVERYISGKILEILKKKLKNKLDKTFTLSEPSPVSM